jgi:hypothetical protein
MQQYVFIAVFLPNPFLGPLTFPWFVYQLVCFRWIDTQHLDFQHSYTASNRLDEDAPRHRPSSKLYLNACRISSGLSLNDLCLETLNSIFRRLISSTLYCLHSFSAYKMRSDCTCVANTARSFILRCNGCTASASEIAQGIVWEIC